MLNSLLESKKNWVKPGRTNKSQGSKRRGMVAVYVALSLIVILAMVGFAVDSSFLYQNRAKVQRAADAAALAGAVQLAIGKTKADADVAAIKVAKENGYDTADGVSVTTTYPVPGNPSWYEVKIARTEPLFFMKVLGFKTKVVSAPATALFEQAVNINVYGVGQYGATGPMNLSVFGPYASHANGDNYSTLYLDSTTAAYYSGAKSGDANPNYLKNGYDFHVQIPSNFRTKNSNARYVDVEIFDPDTYNKSGGGGNVNDADGDNRVDEIRDPVISGKTKTTTTVYTLYYTNETADPSDDYQIATATYAGSSTTDMKWVKPSNFQIDLQSSRWSGKWDDENAFRLNVRSTDGSSENGFLLRAGPTRSGNTAFNSNNGTSVTASGKIPINFNEDNSSVKIQLGYVPAGATSFYVDKFDTDVGALSVTYSDGTRSFTGKLTANGQSLRDTYTLPANYPGGTWTATYKAGAQDTSSWSMYYSGPPINRPGTVRLVR